MRLTLHPHHDRPCAAVTDLAVEIANPRAGLIVLRYVVSGTIGDIRLPAATAPLRRDELWRHTCFEAFIGTVEERGYYEFNFAPSTQWASYRFTDYRQGMAVADETGMPAIDIQTSPVRYTLQALFSLDSLSALPRAARRRLGLSAVIEETNGRLSYWALAHPSGQPDFHDAEGFTYELPAATRVVPDTTGT